MKETMISCTCCGAEVHPEDVIYVGTQPICPDYAETETFVCDHCGFRFWNGDNMGDGRFDLCESCRDEYYVTCSECGQLLRNIEAYYEDSDEDGETPYCEGCYRRKVGDALHSYSYKPSPIFYGDGSLYLGVELEVDGAGKSASNARAILNVMNRRKNTSTSRLTEAWMTVWKWSLTSVPWRNTGPGCPGRKVWMPSGPCITAVTMPAPAGCMSM